ncbi:hypothetical protein N7533_004348 [Penicillium manginii]|uniref:uncharacterized protein n=1 Tax=Penicillium manginii TaxID=203109 RepID=UPI0025484AAB|nr:uncharacterized protein N7533_004348 [Penicillium manginii]KAJ5754805.1 hypothetical protein N7533_004348 [Penicillium manginii]
MNTATANWISYGDVINKWRFFIGLNPLSSTEGPSLAEALKVPFTYCWSPALAPKPQDWPSHIDVVIELAGFLKSGPPPIYIGFGSIVIDDSQTLINTVLNAVSLTGVRAVVSS